MSSENSEDSDLDNQITKMVLHKQVATTPISILIESLVKNLCTLIEKDEKRALKIYNKICTKLYEMKLIDKSYKMTEFEGIRNQYQRALYHLVTAARDETMQIQHIWPSESFDTKFSHYYGQFEELEFIAGGGFGQVFKVRHKLDDSLYAVKKIIIRGNGIKSVMEYLSEVKTFASLNHFNIVQYKSAWLELGVNTTTKAIEMPENTYSDVFGDLSLENQLKTDSFRLNQENSFTVEFEQSVQSSHVSELSKNCDKNSEVLKKSMNSLSNPENSTKFITNSRNSISEGGKAICKFNFTDHRNWATLYIQMSLCQITLKQYLDNRNQLETAMEPIVRLQTKERRDTIQEILCQILKGVEYIHSKGVVHHDIKPSNVFVQSDGGKLSVQLGDFGLACPLQSSRHSLAFGTKLYAAPEQLDGKCDPKSDMYSVGIILLELTDSYLTDMERVQHINELRRGRLPAYISATDPPLAATISQLAGAQPWARPTAADLLARITTDEVGHLTARLRESQRQVERLKAMLKEKGVEVD